MTNVNEKDRECFNRVIHAYDHDAWEAGREEIAAHREAAVAPLEAEVARLQVLADARQDMLDANAATARAKFAPLVEALERIAEWGGHGDDRQALVYLRSIARAALSRAKGEKP